MSRFKTRRKTRATSGVGGPRFDLGSCVTTPGAAAVLAAAGVVPAVLLDRHVHGDWGDLDEDDTRANEVGAKYGSRIVSTYSVEDERLWVITEADRSVTTILRPDEYFTLSGVSLQSA